LMLFLAAAPPLRAARADFVDEAICFDLAIRALHAVGTAPRAVTAATPPSATSQRGGRTRLGLAPFRPGHTHSNAPFAPSVQPYCAGGAVESYLRAFWCDRLGKRMWRTTDCRPPCFPCLVKPRLHRTSESAVITADAEHVTEITVVVVRFRPWAPSPLSASSHTAEHRQRPQGPRLIDFAGGIIGVPQLTLGRGAASHAGDPCALGRRAG
jgi:hypothetical protein